MLKGWRVAVQTNYSDYGSLERKLRYGIVVYTSRVSVGVRMPSGKTWAYPSFKVKPVNRINFKGEDV